MTAANIKKIHEATLQILEETGIKFTDQETPSFLQDHGCKVGPKGMIVRFPPSLVDDCVQKCPPEFTLHARNPKYDILFDSSSVHFAACSGMAILDLDTMERRPGTLKDAVEAARLCDALDNVAGPIQAWVTSPTNL